jgi:conjugal transfer ATP-binding protein TraC
MLKAIKEKLNKGQREEKAPGKNQPNPYKDKPTTKRLVTPSMMKSVVPTDVTATGRANDYWVEVGGTVVPTRYYRSFFSALTGTTTIAGMFDQLYQGAFGEADSDVVLDIVPADPERSLYDITREIAGLESDIMTEPNPNKKAFLFKSLEDLRQQQARIRLGTEKLFFVSLQATVSSPNFEEFKKFCNSLVKRFAGKGIFLKAADNRQLDALLRLSPLQDEDTLFNDAYRTMESSNVADLFMLNSDTIRHKSGIIVGETPSGKTILYNPWHPSLENAHMVIFGQSGSGKSYLVKGILRRAALNHILVGVLDNGIEYKLAIEESGGAYMTLGADSPHKINIFDVEETLDEDGEYIVDIEESVNFAQIAIVKMIKTVDDSLINGRVLIKLQEKIRDVYNKFGINETYESLFESSTGEGKFSLTGTKRKKMPTLSDLYLLMKEDEVLKEVNEVLINFTRFGNVRSQAIFDCESTVNFKDLDIFGISLARLDEQVMKPIGKSIALKFLWEKFGKKMSDKPKMLVLDEIQELLVEKDEARWVEKAFRQARKEYLSMVGITQGFEVFVRSEEGLGIIKNASTKFMLRQEKLDIDAVAGKFDLTAREAQLLLKPPEKGFYVAKIGNESTMGKMVATAQEDYIYSTDPLELAKRKREKQRTQQETGEGNVLFKEA